MKKIKKTKIKRFILLIISIIAILFLIFVIIKKPEEKEKSKTIIGTWTTDGVTNYQFNKNGTGILIVPLSEYEFTYKMEDDSLLIDFKNEKSTDSKYKFYFEDEKLILEGTNGKFTFKKVEEKKN